MTTISAEAMMNNNDLLKKIFLRLQLKPLVRFKCVSKQWMCLISDPQFCVAYNRRHHTATALLLNRGCILTPMFKIVPVEQHTTPRVPFFYYLTAIKAPYFRIWQSCNGLLLYTIQQHGQSSTYCVCNPTTKQFKILCFPSDKDSLVCITFNPLKSNYYKVICVRRYEMDMYSSETDSWRSPITTTFTSPPDMNNSKPVFCNGKVHWYIDDFLFKTALYFDVDTECFNTMLMPNLDHPRRVQYVGESRGHLHLIVAQDPFSLKFDVLEMAADYLGWFVRYHVDHNAPELIGIHQDMVEFFVLHVHCAQREEESIIVALVDKKVIISYNLHNGKSNMLCDMGTHHFYHYLTWSRTFQYFAILTSL